VKTPRAMYRWKAPLIILQLICGLRWLACDVHTSPSSNEVRVASSLGAVCLRFDWCRAGYGAPMPTNQVLRIAEQLLEEVGVAVPRPEGSHGEAEYFQQKAVQALKALLRGYKPKVLGFRTDIAPLYRTICFCCGSPMVCENLLKDQIR
jgi:hypothetical protein